MFSCFRPSTASRHLAIAAAIGAIGLSAGCQRYVDVQLNLVEPCDQRNQALNGINTYQVTADVGGGSDPVITRFTAGEAAPPLEAPIGEGTVVTVEGWTADGSADNSVFNTAPNAIGRTVPLALDENTSTDIVLITGRRDSIGEVANVEGSCQELQSGESVPGRHGHTATFIEGTSLVLIVGGAIWVDDPQAPGQRQEVILKSAELFDTATGTITVLPELPNPRAYHTATALSDGTVLVAGGFSVINQNLGTLSSGFIFDPTRIDADAGPYTTILLRQDRAHHTATYIPDSEIVVIIGGCNGPGCQTDLLFDAGTGDPASLVTSVEVYSVNDRASVPGEPLIEPRAMHAASTNGRQVFVSGGVRSTGLVCSLEAFQASGNSVTSIPLQGNVGALTPCRARHAQVTLTDPGATPSRVAIIGGYVESEGGRPNGTPSANVVFWNTQAGSETTPGSLITGRAGHRAAKMQDGNVFIYGGDYILGGAPAEKLVLQVTGAYQAAALTVPPVVATNEAAIAPLPNNQVFISGGYSASNVTSAKASLYFGE